MSRCKHGNDPQLCPHVHDDGPLDPPADSALASCALHRIDDGGPAFPITGHDDWKETGGMSLRAWLAGQAMAGLVAGNAASDETSLEPECAARWGVMYADALIAELKKEAHDAP